MAEFDVAVIGAGIVGLAVAREFSERHPGSNVLVVEKESSVAAHQTGHNSGVIHGGIYYAPGSLKARLCVEGSRLMYEYCEQHGIAHERCGKLIVAVRRDELGRLGALEERGVPTGLPVFAALVPRRSARSSRTPAASPPCTHPTPASSTMRKCRVPSIANLSRRAFSFSSTARSCR